MQIGSVQTYIIHFSVCYNKQVTQAGPGDHGPDRLVKRSVKQAAPADRINLALLFVVDIYFIPRNVNISVLHRKVDTAGILSAFVIEIQLVLRIPLGI